MLTFTQVFRFTALLLLAASIQCRDETAPTQSVQEPIQGQKTRNQPPTSPSPQDGAVTVGGQGQGLRLEPPVPCRLDTLSADQGGSKTKEDPSQVNTLELGVQTEVPKGKATWTPYMQHRCR